MRILLIEDHPIVRAGCRRLLQDHLADDAAFDVMEASTGAEALALNAAARPDIALLDLNLPDMPGMDVLRLLRQQTPQLAVIVFSMYEDVPFVTAALEAGAQGYVTKNDDPASMLEAIERVQAGGRYLAPRVAQRLALQPFRDHDPLAELSVREREVFGLLGKGQSLTEIAGLLGVSYRTAANAAAQTKAKLKLGSAAALIKHAVDNVRSDLP